jgi:hypothetical protein
MTLTPSRPANHPMLTGEPPVVCVLLADGEG